jgi:polysaccharide biosynthesis transport protein
MSSSRRRILVFCCTFLPALAASLTYVYTRPAEYRAVARLRISPAAVVTQPTEQTDTPTVATDAKSFLTEVQVLTSRPLLQDALERLRRGDGLPDLGADPVATAQQMLRAEPVEGTQVVQLSAEGREPEFVPRLVNTVADAYRQHIVDAYKGVATSTYGEVTAEIRALEQEVTAKRDAINGFRGRYDIVSMEHKENDVLANIEGLSQSYTDANQRLAKAQGHLQALMNAVAAGKAVVRAKDDPTIADLEQRASVLHEQWHDLERRFTPAYLALDADARSLRARLENLDQQLKAQRTASQKAALAEANEELAASQAAVDQLRKDMSDNQRQAQDFATHLSDYKALREDLDHIEGMHRAALDRLAKLQASELERAPRVELLEAAASSHEPWRPDYQLNAAISLVGSLAFGLFAAWFVDFLAGPARAPTMEVQHSWAPALLGREPAPAGLPPLAGREMPRLEAPELATRELADGEIAALVAAAKDEEALLIVLLLLTGLTAEELIALRWDDIDLDAGVIRVDGAGARTILLQEPLLGALTSRGHRQTVSRGTVLLDRQGTRLAIDEVERLVLFAADDAGLARSHEVTPEVLRYTYLSFLLRQGIRAADVDRIVGCVPLNALAAYMRRHSPAARRPLEQVERVLPALRALADKRLIPPAIDQV